MKGTPMARKRKENISEVMFSYIGTDAQFDEFLKMLLTKAEAQESLIKMQTSAENFEKQAGSLNEKYSSGCKALTETTKNALTTILNDTKKQLSNTVQETRKKIRTCAWISITAVILCAALCALAVLWSR